MPCEKIAISIDIAKPVSHEIRNPLLNAKPALTACADQYAFQYLVGRIGYDDD
ncbi:hypothetical protein BH09SUM1_BH09SUM1_04950 [soil metagenome]